jgi:hypothetical protein
MTSRCLGAGLIAGALALSSSMALAQGDAEQGREGIQQV